MLFRSEKGIEAEEHSPTPECLTAIQERLDRMLSLMGLPSAVQVSFDGDTILCSITGAHEEYIAGQDGRILDNLSYHPGLPPVLPRRHRPRLVWPIKNI